MEEREKEGERERNIKTVQATARSMSQQLLI